MVTFHVISTQRKVTASLLAGVMAGRRWHCVIPYGRWRSVGEFPLKSYITSLDHLTTTFPGFR